MRCHMRRAHLRPRLDISAKCRNRPDLSGTLYTWVLSGWQALAQRAPAAPAVRPQPWREGARGRLTKLSHRTASSQTAYRALQ